MPTHAPTLVIRLRRLLALLLLAVAAAVGGIYLRQRRSDALAARTRKPVLPIQTTFSQSTSGVRLVGTQEGRRLFVLSSDTADQLKIGNQMVLHHVRIQIYAADGEAVSDEIRGAAFGYDPKAGLATAQGDVEIDWNARPAVADMAPAGAAQKLTAAPPSPVHVLAHSLVFNLKTGAADVSQGLTFSFRAAVGRAATAHLQDSDLTLDGGLRVDWTPPPPAPDSTAPPVRGPRVATTVTAGHCAVNRSTGQVELRGAVTVYNATQRLEADELRLAFNPDDNSLEHAGADGHLRILENDPARRTTTTAAHGEAEFRTAAAGAQPELARTQLLGAVEMRLDEPAQSARLSADSLDTEFAAGNALERAMARGAANTNARLVFSTAPAAGTPPASRTLEAPELDLAWAPLPVDAPAHASPPLRSVESKGRTHAEIAGAAIPDTPAISAPAAQPPLLLDADRLHVDLDAAQQLTHAWATGDVHLAQPQPLGMRTATGEALTLAFVPDGAGKSTLDTLRLERQVALGEPLAIGQRRFRADTLTYAADGHMVLTADAGSVYSGGRVTEADPQSTFSAAKVDVLHPDGAELSEMDADGGVTLTLLSGAGLLPGAPPPPGAPAQPLSIVAERAHLHEVPNDRRSNGGSGTFTGQVRIWQGADILYADRVDINRATGVLVADGKVITQYVTAAAPSQPQPASRSATATAARSGNRAAAGAGLAPKSALRDTGQPRFVEVRAAHLEYNDTAHQAAYTGAVALTSGDMALQSRQLQVWTQPADNAAAASSLPASGLQRALATGDVHATMNQRTATADRLDYNGRTQVAILTGANPRICDAEQGCVAGDPLTYSLADDAMTIGSKNGPPANGQVQIH